MSPSQQSAQAIRDEHAASSRARRSRREQEKYFQRTPPQQQRADNVRAAMANGSFAQTRFSFNQDNPKLDMDAAGNIRAKSREENIAAAKENGTFDRQRAEYNAKNIGAPMDEKGNIKPVRQADIQGPPRSAMPQPMGPPKTLMQRRPVPTTGTINGKPAGEVFQSLADQQQRPNKFAQPRQAPAAQTTPAATPSPTWGKTAGEIIADIDRTQADVAENMGRASAAFKPRQAPQTAAAPHTLKGPQQLNPGAQSILTAGATPKADTAPKAPATTAQTAPQSAMQKFGDFMFGGAKTAATNALKSAEKFMQNRTFVSEDEPKPNRVAAQ